MNKYVFSLLLMLSLLCCVACGKSDSSNEGQSNSNANLLTRDSEGLLSGQFNIEIEYEKFGTIALTLDADIAPVSVTNFINLVNQDFYDGLTMHRIIRGFMMQGGAPASGEDSLQNIQGEFASNGIENNLKHTRGVISMARTPIKDSASSQFFIMHQDAPHLDGEYAAFGWVTSGIEVVDAICDSTQVIDGNGTVLPGYEPIIKEIRIVE